MARPRLTGFARFILFLLVAAPLIYFGVAYFKGEDPVGQVREWTGMETTVADREQDREAPLDCAALRAENAQLKAEVARLRGE